MESLRSTRSGGQIVLIVAFTIFVLLGMAGLAIDGGSAYLVKAKLNAAVDAAAIGGARAVVEGTNDDARAAAAAAAGAKFYSANFPPDYLGATVNAPTIQAVHNSKGYWTVTAAGSATVQTRFMGLFGINKFLVVNAAGQAIRRDVDMMLVLDTSGSLGSPPSPSGTFNTLKSASVSFVNKFVAGPGGDRVGLVSFASGAVINVPLNKDAIRGFDRTVVTNAINALSVSGSTASAEGFRRALAEIRSVPVAYQSSLRVIVFFSDGAPNDVPGTFPRSSGGPVTGDLYSEITSGPAPSRVYRIDQRDRLLGTYTNISALPTLGLPPVVPPRANDVTYVPLASYNNMRVLTGTPYSNTRCNVNKAARNLIENVANIARSENVRVLTLGLGADLNTLEVTFCGYNSTELGANILKRLANTYDPNNPSGTSDTYNSAQPAGLYCYAADASRLNACFNEIASEILRLSM